MSLHLVFWILNLFRIFSRADPPLADGFRASDLAKVVEGWFLAQKEICLGSYSKYKLLNFYV